ncbi:hypothetical protein OAB07_02675 [Candidatus Pelagibacter sp.]|nr:hypothetical protein [Candidatus Pelagibacter sp.]
MYFNGFDRGIARIVVLQRIELGSFLLLKIRKLFGRYLFTNFFTRFFITKNKINCEYYTQMESEYEAIKKFINFDNKNILSIGAGMCGLELIINAKHAVDHFSIIEKNYISKKVKYGWDNKNLEAYNNLDYLRKFIKKNNVMRNFKVFDCDKDKLPINSFDVVISLFSLDYHYDFNLYSDYFKKISKNNTLFIFDTIRPYYFRGIFKNVDVISSSVKDIHSSKRLICKNFIK